MTVNQPPAECWVIVNDNDNDYYERGEILAAHCDCPAGPGETCSHVSAVLYALSYAREICLGKKVLQKDNCITIFFSNYFLCSCRSQN